MAYLGTKPANAVLTSEQIGDGVIATADLADGAITSAKIAAGQTPSFNGIAFPATQVASANANTLDDYEEGTWTPIIIGTSTAGTGTYTTQVGRYTKIGNIVIANAFFVWSAHTGTGNMWISGLPFTTSNTSNLYFPATIGYTLTLAVNANTVLSGYSNINSTNVILESLPVSGGTSSPVAMDSAAGIMFTVTYQV
jgi:hypothetical protein